MYLWKCWHDTRSFFIFFLVIATAVMPITGVVGVGTRLMEEFGTTVFQSTLVFMLFVVALGLGTLGAIQEFTDKTAHFLFTKPRSRAYFVWTGWAVGCVQLLVIAVVNLVAGWLTLAHYSKSPLRSVFSSSIKQQDVASIFLYAIFVYSLTYSLTVILRNGLKGLGASMGSIAALQCLAIVIRSRWNITVPIPPLPVRSLPLLVSYIAWIIVALLFIVGAQLVIERTEI
jgi:ABC-type transport system involved in multi-copper enzyme maturation permease subunit